MKIWYTKGLSNTQHALQLIRRDWPRQKSLSLLASHLDPDAPVAIAADTFLIEPKTISDDDYAAWCLDTACAHQVDLVVVQRRPAALWALREAFETRGIRLLLPGKPETLQALHEKNRFCDIVEGLGIPGTEYRLFSTPEEFEIAEAEMLSTEVAARHGLCIKPVTGIYGSGFRILVKDSAASEIDRMLNVNNIHLDRDLFLHNLEASRKDRTFMLMGYLPGAERSLDFIAHKGRFIAGVVRRKDGSTQTLEIDGESFDYARTLTDLFGLDGVCNMQTKEVDGRPHVLEINPRMSGGMQMACLSGLNLPYWSARLALGLASPEDLPAAKGDVRTCSETIALKLPAFPE